MALEYEMKMEQLDRGGILGSIRTGFGVTSGGEMTTKLHVVLMDALPDKERTNLRNAMWNSLLILLSASREDTI